VRSFSRHGKKSEEHEIPLEALEIASSETASRGYQRCRREAEGRGGRGLGTTERTPKRTS
jgi:hypothetical protein